MRFYEFLVEYNRNIMLKQTSPKILDAVKNDGSLNFTEELDAIRSYMQWHKEVEPEKQEMYIQSVLLAIEDKDPTPNKQYVPWLVRMYTKGGVKYEDLNRMNMLGLYELGKKRKLIKPEDRDINRFKTYSSFESTMMANYDLESFTQDEEQTNKQVNASKVYEDGDVIVIVPHDEEASCKYGRNTRWCTAATKGYNYFDTYNKKGPLYILIPKNPEHNGEKYQLHFGTSSYMNEHDESVLLKDLLELRFPGLYQFFVKTHPEFQYSLEFVLDYELEEAFEVVKQFAIELVNKKAEEAQFKDKEYLKYLEHEGFIDNDGDIDWEEVEEQEVDYREFNPSYDEAIKLLQNGLNAETLWYRDDGISTYERMTDVRRLPEYMARDIYWSGVRNYDIDAGTYSILHDLESELSTRQLIKTSKGEWKVTN